MSETQNNRQLQRKLGARHLNMIAIGGSIGTGLLIMSVAYFICGLIPAIFIKNRLFDPQKAD